MTVSVFIDGAAGTTGLEIRQRLADRPEIALLTLPEASRKDAAARRDALNDADIVILCLPDDAAREAVALIDNPRTRVIDASTAHRVSPGWVYGLPEVTGRKAVADAMRVSNPGCYATGFITLIAPLVRTGLIPADWPLSCNAVSGYSGGGKPMIAEYEDASAEAPAVRAYALDLNHKHVPEMQLHAGLSVAPIFSPSVANTFRGMIVQVPLPVSALPGSPCSLTIGRTLKAFYHGCAVVRVDGSREANLPIDRLADTDRLNLLLFGNLEETRVALIAVLDNLGKGAAGAAVQNLNLMAGLPETQGLKI